MSIKTIWTLKGDDVGNVLKDVAKDHESMRLKVFEKSAERIRLQAVSDAPVDTGKLREGIRAIASVNGIVVGWRRSVFYGYIQEKRNTPHVVPAGLAERDPLVQALGSGIKKQVHKFRRRRKKGPKKLNG